MRKLSCKRSDTKRGNRNTKNKRDNKKRSHTRKLRGGRGGDLGGHAYTTGASQTLYQLSGRTPGLSSG
jgi:hypothetical protein